MDDAVDILERELGGQLPDGFTALSDEQLLALADLLHDAKARQKPASSTTASRNRWTSCRG